MLVVAKNFATSIYLLIIREITGCSCVQLAKYAALDQTIFEGVLNYNTLI